MEERWRILAGTVAATIRNVKRQNIWDKVWNWFDFFAPVKKYSPTWQSAEDLDRIFSTFDTYARVKQNGQSRRSSRKGRH